MTLLDDWPSLAPIRTSSTCYRDSRVCCETLSINESPSPPPDHPCPASSHQSSEKSLVSQKYDPLPPLRSGDVPTSSAASSTICALSSTGRHFFSQFHPCRAAPHKLSKPAASPRRGASDCGGFLRSVASFSGPIHHSGTVAHSAAISHARPIKLGAGPIFGHPKMFKGHASNKGHVAKMIPPNLLGRKTGVGYESDLPTSPEVTCMGRVRRKKHRKALEAVGKPSNLGVKKGKKVDIEGLPKVDVEESPGIDDQSESPRGANASRWRQVLGVRESSESQNTIDMNRRSNFENLRIDLGRFSSAFELSLSTRDVDDALRSPLIGGELPLEESNLILTDNTDRFTSSEDCVFDSTDKGDHCPITRPPPNCLLLMRNSGRSRGKYTYDEIFGAPPKSHCPVEKDAVIKRHTEASIWKRRGTSELLSWDLKERLKLKQKKSYTR